MPYPIKRVARREGYVTDGTSRRWEIEASKPVAARIKYMKV
jgi:hypothetical protein